MPSVLFVCNANRFRSPLAAALLERKLQRLGMADAWTIGSAGLWATSGQPALGEVAEAAGRFNIDLSHHRSTRVSRALLASHDLIVVMQSSQREALLTEFPELDDHIYLFSNVVERRTYDISDAVGSAREMLELISELDTLIGRGLESFCVLAASLHNARHIAENG